MNLLPKLDSASAYNDYLSSYKEWLSRQEVTPNTVRAYHSRIKQFLLFLEYANVADESLSLDDLSYLNEVMNLYLHFLKESKGEVRSLNANINALNNFSHFLGLESGQLKQERGSYKAPKTLTINEQEELLHSIERQESARDRALALVLFYTGLRVGDCANLNIDNVLIDNELNESSNTRIQKADTACLCFSDGTKIQLNKSTTLALSQWLEERKNLGGSAARSALWLTQRGQRLSVSGIAFLIKRIGWQAQLVISAEVLRRTWLATATNHLNKQKLASKFGRHVSAATINRYGILLPAGQAVSSAMSDEYQQSLDLTA